VSVRPPLTRGQLRALLRLPARPDDVPVEVLERVALPHGRRSRIAYPGSHGAPVPAFLFEPHDAHGGAVVVQHQHASRWHEGKSEVAGLVGEPLQAFGPALMARGWRVLAPDAPGFEDRRRTGPGLDRRESDWKQYYDAMAYRLVQGRLLVSEAVGDLEVAVGLLAAQPGVDPDRVGFLGHSHGGNLGQWLAAADERVRFACVSGSLGSYRAKLAHGVGLEFSLVVPGVLDHLDVDDLVRLVPPRPLLVVAGTDDPYALDAADVLARVAPWPGLTWRIRPGGHALDEERHQAILDWFALRA